MCFRVVGKTTNQFCCCIQPEQLVFVANHTLNFVINLKQVDVQMCHDVLRRLMGWWISTFPFHRGLSKYEAPPISAPRMCKTAAGLTDPAVPATCRTPFVKRLLDGSVNLFEALYLVFGKIDFAHHAEEVQHAEQAGDDIRCLFQSVSETKQNLAACAVRAVVVCGV